MHPCGARFQGLQTPKEHSFKCSGHCEKQCRKIYQWRKTDEIWTQIILLSYCSAAVVSEEACLKRYFLVREFSIIFTTVTVQWQMCWFCQSIWTSNDLLKIVSDSKALICSKHLVSMHPRASGNVITNNMEFLSPVVIQIRCYFPRTHTHPKMPYRRKSRSYDQGILNH